jgi:drug/metabolite transporter (DMT)-like permease
MLTKTSPLNNYLLLILLSVIWGGQFLANDLSLRQLSPLSICALRILLGLATIQAIIWFVKIKPQNNPRTNAKMWLFYAILGIFEIIIPMYTVPWGQQVVPSSTASILIATIPIFTIILSAFLPKEKLGVRDWIAVVLGFAAMCILSGVTNLNMFLLGELFGEVAILIGSFSLAVFLVLARKIPKEISSLIVTRNFLLASFVLVVPFAAIYDHWWLMPRLDLTTIVAMLFLGTQCTGTAFIILMLLIERGGPVFASFSNYLIPFTGVLLGVVFLGEKLHNNSLVALLLIFCGLFIREYKFKLKK